MKKFKRKLKKVLIFKKRFKVSLYLTIDVKTQHLKINEVGNIINNLFKTHQLLKTGQMLTVEKPCAVLI